MYISGSDLEDAGEDDLSAIVGEQIEEEHAMQASISEEKSKVEDKAPVRSWRTDPEPRHSTSVK